MAEYKCSVGLPFCIARSLDARIIGSDFEDERIIPSESEGISDELEYLPFRGNPRGLPRRSARLREGGRRSESLHSKIDSSTTGVRIRWAFITETWIMVYFDVIHILDAHFRNALIPAPTHIVTS